MKNSSKNIIFTKLGAIRLSFISNSATYFSYLIKYLKMTSIFQNFIQESTASKPEYLLSRYNFEKTQRVGAGSKNVKVNILMVDKYSLM